MKIYLIKSIASKYSKYCSLNNIVSKTCEPLLIFFTGYRFFFFCTTQYTSKKNSKLLKQTALLALRMHAIRVSGNLLRKEIPCNCLPKTILSKQFTYENKLRTTRMKSDSLVCATRHKLFDIHGNEQSKLLTSKVGFMNFPCIYRCSNYCSIYIYTSSNQCIESNENVIAVIEVCYLIFLLRRKLQTFSKIFW